MLSVNPCQSYVEYIPDWSWTLSSWLARILWYHRCIQPLAFPGVEEFNMKDNLVTFINSWGTPVNNYPSPSSVQSGKQTHRPREADISPMGSSHMARVALQHSLYRPETTSPKGSSQYRSREALNIAHRKLSTSPSLSSVCPVLLSTPLLATSTTWRALSYPSSSQTQAVAT